MTLLSHDTLRRFLDSIMGGATVKQAVINVGGHHHSTASNWIARSKIDEAAGKTDSELFLSWPTEATPDYFHNLYKLAYKRRSKILLGAWEQFTHGRFAVENSRAAFEIDDFGQVTLDEFGMPKWKEILIAEPALTGKHRENPDEVLAASRPRRELAPSSYSGNKPKPVPAYTGSALGDYLKANAPKSRPMTELERDLREKLAAGPKNAKPSAPVPIIRDKPDDAQRERINRPSDQSGLPRTAEVSREPAPRPAYARPPRLDGARVPPPGGFKVG